VVKTKRIPSGFGCLLIEPNLREDASDSLNTHCCSARALVWNHGDVAQWADMKKAGKTEGQTWPQFWSQCSKDYAAKNGGSAEPEQPTKTSKKARTVAVDESDSTGSGQQKKDCDAKWGAYKTKTGSHGWHDYFQFMAKCM
jgi:hypothetical protein